MPLRASRLCTWPNTLQFILGALLPLVLITNVRWGCRDPGLHGPVGGNRLLAEAAGRPARLFCTTCGRSPIASTSYLHHRITCIASTRRPTNRPLRASNRQGTRARVAPRTCLGARGERPVHMDAPVRLVGMSCGASMPEACMYSAAGRGAILCAAAGMRAAILLLAACMPAQPRPPAGWQLDGGAPPACRAVAAIAVIGSACL